MTDPSKVRGFLDVAGRWDPSLAAVMAGAIAITAIGFRVASARRAPLFDDRFHFSSLRTIDRRLVVGSAIFGVGWGLAGLCPGPAVVALGSFVRGALPFVAAMIVGTRSVDFVDARTSGRTASKHRNEADVAT
jgi:uncharacterized membrane protein YedE/YeeE